MWVWLLAGCGLDVVGTWQIATLDLDGVSVADAGFVDIRTNGDVSSGVPHALVLRYQWDPYALEWVPDPTPFVETMSFDVFAFQDDPGQATLRLDLPFSDGNSVTAAFQPDVPRAGAWVLEQPDFELGALEFVLER